MKKSLIFTLILLSIFGCGLKPMSDSGETESKVTEENVDSEAEFEFGVDSKEDALGSLDHEASSEDHVASTTKEKDEFVDDEFMAKPAEPSFSEFKVADNKKKKESVREYTIETPITPLAVRETPKKVKQDKVVIKYEERPKNMVFDEGFSDYHVQKGDTLMIIGFKLFGDYRYWKELKEWNGVKSQDLAPGSIIKYKTASNGFRWSPNGLPHLVKNGEYLGSISMDKYGTSKRWREIFENNRPMLRDPNLIFAGFTIYYVPDKRGVASEK